MLFTIFSVFYVLIAAAMIVLILMQRGDGANAGASFGGGASGTVFGARGSASFLTRATGVLAAIFFALSLGMGVYMNVTGGVSHDTVGLGVMEGLAEKPAEAPKSSTVVTHSEVPQAAPAANTAVPPAQAATSGEVPAAPTPDAKH